VLRQQRVQLHRQELTAESLQGELVNDLATQCVHTADAAPKLQSCTWWKQRLLQLHLQETKQRQQVLYTTHCNPGQDQALAVQCALAVQSIILGMDVLTMHLAAHWLVLCCRQHLLQLGQAAVAHTMGKIKAC
jgi:hypothetical protein